MFIAAVFGQKLEGTQVYIFGRMDKLWYTHRMEYSNKNEQTIATIWNDPYECHKRTQLQDSMYNNGSIYRKFKNRQH